jgi:hypothetical protein
MSYCVSIDDAFPMAPIDRPATFFPWLAARAEQWW